MKKIAMQTGTLNSVALPDGRFVNPARAVALGFEVESFEDSKVRRAHERSQTSKANTTPVEKTDVRRRIEYMGAVEALPEAAGRPHAASEIWAKHTAESMPLHRAASFLRGLPLEVQKPKTSTSPTLSAEQIHKFRRKVEIRIMGLEMNANKGRDGKRQEAHALNQALALQRRTSCSFGVAFSAFGLDARQTITDILS